MNNAEREEIIRLSESLLDGQIERVEIARLEELIEDSDEALDVYLMTCNDISLIRDSLRKMAVAPSYDIPQSEQNRYTIWPMGVAVLVTILLSVWVFFPSKKIESELGAQIHSDARMTGAVGVRWAKGGERYSYGDPLVGENVVIEQGALEVTCDNGVVLLIEGPASFNLRNAMDMRLDYGNLVADVPLQGRGFTVEYGKHRLIDHGTKFGMRVSQDEDIHPIEIAVFQGEVEVLPANAQAPIMLGRYDAIVLDQKSGTGVYSIPLDKKKFLRELPLAEIPWDMPRVPKGQNEILEFDVSHLVRGSGKFFAVFKWMMGGDALWTSKVTLLRDGEVVWQDDHVGCTGVLPKTNDNIYWLNISEEFSREARWTLQVTALCERSSKNQSSEENQQDIVSLSDSKGVLYFDDAAYLPASSDVFLGKWRYMHNGIEHQRELLSGGRAFIRVVDGRIQPEASWWMEGDVMHMYFPENGMTERHLLRGDALLFIDRPYRNAHKYEG